MNINMQNIELTQKDGWFWIAERIGEDLYPVEKLLYDDGSQTLKQYEQRLRLQGSWNIERMSYGFKFF